MTNNPHDLLHVVIRGAGERSLPLCIEAIKNQNVIFSVINEYPFLKAIQKTFEIGVQKSTPFILALDADVILGNDAILSITNEAVQSLQTTPKLLSIDFKVWDKFRGLATAGCHLYVNLYSKELLNYFFEVKDNPQEPRPEKENLQNFAKRHQLIIKKSETVVGKHDFEQFYRDIYIKYFRRAMRYKKSDQIMGIKNDLEAPATLETISRIVLYLLTQANAHPEDLDYLVALKGLYAGQEGKEIPFDARNYPPIKEVLGINEKLPLEITDG